MKRVGGQLGRVAALRAEASERLRDRLGVDPRRAEHRLAIDQLGRRRAGGAGRRTALGAEARPLDQPVPECEREPDQVATDGAAGGAVEAAGQRLAAMAAVVEVVAKDVGIHARARAARAETRVVAPASYCG